GVGDELVGVGAVAAADDAVVGGEHVEVDAVPAADGEDVAVVPEGGDGGAGLGGEAGEALTVRPTGEGHEPAGERGAGHGHAELRRRARRAGHGGRERVVGGEAAADGRYEGDAGLPGVRVEDQHRAAGRHGHVVAQHVAGVRTGADAVVAAHDDD